MEQVTLTKKNLHKIINQYNIGQLGEVRPIKTSGNLSFVVITSTGEYFLRLCGQANRWRSAREIEGELKLINRLRKENFPVSGYERMKNGKKVISIEGFNGYLRRYSKGRQIKGNPTDGQLIKVGKMFGMYHKSIKNYKVAGLRKNIDFGAEKTGDYFNQEKNNILQSEFKDKNKFIEVFTKEIEKIKLPKGLPKGMIHEDLGKRHVLWQNNKIAAIIDFDRSYYGYLILDLGQALRGWCFVDSWRKWSQNNCKHFLTGYRSERELSKQELKYLLPAIKFAILERSLAFCSRYVYCQKPEVGDEKFALDGLFHQIEKIKI